MGDVRGETVVGTGGLSLRVKCEQGEMAVGLGDVWVGLGDV